MKANELRIGNFVYHEGSDFVVKIGHISFGEQVFYSPIHLTEEWLLKFGFDTDEDGMYSIGNVRQKIRMSETNYGGDYDVSFSNDIGIGFFVVTTIQYVHQLQNLYFALTGEELDIKEI